MAGPMRARHGVWLYHRFCLSFRNVEEFLAKRGIIVSYETVRCESSSQLVKHSDSCRFTGSSRTFVL